MRRNRQQQFGGSRTAVAVVATVVLGVLAVSATITAAAAASSSASSSASNRLNNVSRGGGSLWDNSWGAEEVQDEDETFDLDDVDLEEDDEALLAAELAMLEGDVNNNDNSNSNNNSAAQSVSTKTKAKTKAAPTPVAAVQEEEEDERWKDKDDWWQDPLAMFDENDEFVDDVEEVEEEPIQEQEEVEEEELEEEEDLLLVDEEEEAAREAAEEAALLEEIAAEEAAAKKKAEKTAAKAAKKAARNASSSSSTPLKQRLAFLQPGQKQQEQNQQEQKKQTKREPEKESAVSVAALTASVPAFTAALAQGTLVAASLPAVKVLATMAVGKAIYEAIVGRSSSSPSRRRGDSYERSEDPEVDAEYNSIVMENPMHYSTEDPARYDSEDEDESEFEHDHHHMDISSDVESSSTTATIVGHHDMNHNHRRHNNNKSQQQGGVFGGLRSVLVGGGSGRSPVMAGAPTSGGLLTRKVRVTADELEFLKVQAEKAVVERQGMEQEYERTSYQLAEAQSEVTQLASTTKYLKSQLRDYEEMMDRTIRNERRKAKAEIARIKSNLEMSREEEQEALRKQFVKEMRKMQGTYEAERAEREAMMVRAGASSPNDESNNHSNKNSYLREEHQEVSRQYDDIEETPEEGSAPARKQQQPKKPKSTKKKNMPNSATNDE